MSTPQDVALAEAKKGAEMLKKVEVPVLGIVENMSVFHSGVRTVVTSHCHIFSAEGAVRLAKEMNLDIMGMSST